MVGTTSGVIFTENGENHDMQLFQGKTISFTLTWGGSSPIDVTGYDARMQVRKDTKSTSTAAEFTVANGRVNIGTTNGLITFSMSAADSATLVSGQYVYDIEVIDDSSNVYLALSGDCRIIAEVTK